jgi:hypothetical protein
MWRINDVENSEIINKDKKFTVVNRVTQVINEYVEKKRPHYRDCGTPDVT